MQKLERLTIHHPIIFGFVLILLFTLLSTLTWPITQIFPSPEGYEVGTALAKFVIAACFILLIWGFGWLKTSGFTSLGPKWIWLLVIVLMIFRAIIGIYAFTGSIQFGLLTVELTLAILFYTFATSLLEETMYRGLLLTAMVKAWGSTRRGLYAAAILSGLFWASLHFINLIIHPFPVVALQVLEITMAGFVYAAIVLSSRSIWPVIILHWVVNASVSLQAIQNPNFEETTTAWFIFNLAALPMVGVGIYLMQKLALRCTISKQRVRDEKSTVLEQF